jgi:hypothetical protein
MRHCWYCDFFEAASPGVNNSGRCHHDPPEGIDAKSMISGGVTENVFPQVFDGTSERCGDFKPSTITVATPV